MVKKYFSGILLLSLSVYLGGYLFDKALTYSETEILNNYFCTRTDNSYNVRVEVLKDKIHVSDNKFIREFDLKSIIKKLESADKHRLLDLIINKIRNRSSFNLKINHKLNICGLYNENVYFKEAYVFEGDINNLDLFDFITDPKIKWSKNEGDEELILILVYLFVKNFFNFYTFKFYNEFVIINDYLQKDLCRLDIDYEKIFGIKPKSVDKNFIICELTRVDNGIIVKKVNESFLYSIQEIDPDQNNISNTLKKNCELEIDLEELLYEDKLEEVKNILDVNKIKEDKKLMDFVKKLKEIKEIKKVFGSDEENVSVEKEDDDRDENKENDVKENVENLSEG